MATIKITRSDEYINRMRAIKVFANDKLIGTINNGETKEFALAPGAYNIKAKIDWCSSNTLSFTLNENDIKPVVLTSFSKLKTISGFTILYYLIFAPSKYLRLAE